MAQSNSLATPIDRTLPNGARLVVVVRPDAPYAVVGVWFRGGSAADEAGREGTAHLLEHLLPLCPHDGTTAQIALEQLGGLLLPETGRDFLAFPLMIAAPALPESVQLLTRIVGALSVPTAVVEREKALIALELQALWDDPLWGAKTLVEARLLAGTPYAHPPGGWLTTVPQLSRDDAQRYHARHCHPANAAVIVVVPQPELVAPLEPIAAALPAPSPTATASGVASSDPPTVPPRRWGDRVWAMGWRLAVTADEEPAVWAWVHYWQSALLPNALVGTGVREWRVTVNPTRQGWVIVLAALSRASAEGAQRRVVATLRQAAESPLASETLRWLRQRLLLEHRCRLADPLECARSIGQAWALHDDPTAPLRYGAAINALTAERLQAVAQRMADAEPLTVEWA